MATMRFTQQAVAKLPSPTDVPQAYYWDEEVTGLGVVVGKTGTKTFVVYGRLAGEKGKRVKHKLGIFGQPRDDKRVWSVELARSDAKVVLGKLAMGTNPLLVATRAFLRARRVEFCRSRSRPSRARNYA